jgi:hypothetical protein
LTISEELSRFFPIFSRFFATCSGCAECAGESGRNERETGANRDEKPPPSAETRRRRNREARTRNGAQIGRWNRFARRVWRSVDKTSSRFAVDSTLIIAGTFRRPLG